MECGVFSDAMLVQRRVVTTNFPPAAYLKKVASAHQAEFPLFAESCLSVDQLLLSTNRR